MNGERKPGSPSLAVEYLSTPEQGLGKGLRKVDVDLVPAIHLDMWLDTFEKNLKHVPRYIATQLRKKGFDLVPKETTDGMTGICTINVY